jgi:glycosyltransferase involved in cell wall biosynthesis
MNSTNGVRADHIAIIVHDFSTGGSERIAIRLANQWVRSGRRVTIFCGTSEGAARALIDEGTEVRQANVETRRGLFSRVLLGKRLACQIEAAAPDIVFAPGNFHIPVLISLSIFMNGDLPPFTCKISNPLKGPSRFFKKVFSSRIDTLVAMSEGLARDARAVLGRSHIVTVPEPILDSRPTAAKLDPSSNLVLCIGRLVDQKNFLLAIEAFALCDRADFQLVILGEGPQRGKLERAVRKHGLEGRVHLPGYVPDISPILDRARLLLMTSRYEGYPAVLIEALAKGIPVVTTDCSTALREILADSSFGRVTTADPREVARAIGNVAAGRAPDWAALSPLLDRHCLDEVATGYLELFDAVAHWHQRERAFDQAGVS